MRHSPSHAPPISLIALPPAPRSWLRAIWLWVALSFGIGTPSISLGIDLPIGGANEPTIAVDPSNPRHLAYASLHELRVSTDSGITFQPPVRALIPNGELWAADPSVAFDSQGRLFWSYITASDLFIAQCNPATGEILAGYPVNVTQGLGAFQNPDKEWLTIDCSAGSPYVDRLHLAWIHFGQPTNYVRTSFSTDQGMTWSPTEELGTDPSLGSVWPVHNAVASNGDVYLAYHSQPVTHPTDGISGQVFVSRSTDGGVTYQSPTLAFPPGAADITWNYQDEAGPIPGTRFLTQGSMQPWILPDPNTSGRVYVVACDDPDNQHDVGDDANVYMVTSTDHGSTWSVPARVDSGPGTAVPFPISNPSQLFPTAAIDRESGTIAVHYYDTRNGNVNADGDYLLDVFGTFSQDGGATFSPDVQVNEVPFDPNPGAPCRDECGPILSRVWGSSASDVYVVGFGGKVLHYDGIDWSVPVGTGPDLWGVWGSGPDDVFVVGEAGFIRHYDGISWTLQSSGTTRLLTDVWGTAPDDVFAVGSVGTILHYDGNTWSPQASGTAQWLEAIWGSAPDEVFAVGNGGTILHYDGSWSPLSAPTSEHLGDVWGSAPDDVFTVGYQGGILHYDGISWSLHDSHPGRVLVGIWGDGGADVFAVDYSGGILHYDGNAWSEMSTIYRGWGVWGSSGTDVYAASENGRVYHYDGVTWAEQDNPSLPADPTLRIGEYIGVAIAGDLASVVWCGNEYNAIGDPISQQTIFGRMATTGIDLASSAPPSSKGQLLRQSRPNPFRSRTSIGVELPAAAHVTLRIYDARGSLVRRLLDRQLGANSHSIDWDGRDDRGRTVSSGIYWYQLGVGDRTETRRLVMVR